jgi:energy-coupling factor transporter ATP-binding protein EcfA2
MKKEIELKNVQAITHLKFELPEGGGVVVLLGKNGCGKTTTLNAISEAAGGKKTGLSARDGEKFGTIEAPGVRLRVGKSTTKMGELEFDSIEGRFPLADLVDPGFKDPEACDRVRTKALIQLAGVEPNLEIFREIEGYSEAANNISASPEDVLGMAAALKMEVEKLARSAEESATDALSRSKVLWEQSGGLDATTERDGDKLRRDSERQIRILAEAERTQKERQNQRSQWMESTAQLLTLESASESLDGAILAEQNSRRHAEEKQVELRKLEQEVAIANEQRLQSLMRLESVRKSQDARDKLRESVNAGEPILIPDSEIDGLRKAVEVARSSESVGEIQRKKHIDRAGAENFQRIATGHADWGKQYRAGAARIDGILSEQINKLGVDLAVMEGRLYYDTSRGPTLYHELSDGERWRIALDIAIDIAGQNGLLSIPQASWEALDPANRIAIHEHCKRRGAVIVTAAAADGELRAELFAGA